jgi:hypothetical protein
MAGVQYVLSAVVLLPYVPLLHAMSNTMLPTALRSVAALSCASCSSFALQMAGVQYVLSTVVQALLDNPDRKFSYAEMVRSGSSNHCRTHEACEQASVLLALT